MIARYISIALDALVITLWLFLLAIGAFGVKATPVAEDTAGLEPMTEEAFVGFDNTTR